MMFFFRRTLGAAVTLLGVSVIVFWLMRSLPGNAALILFGGTEAGIMSQEDLEAIEERLGLNDPLPLQFLRWLGKVLMLDFGTSIRTGNPVASDIAARLPNTLQIVFLAAVIAVAVGITLGVISAVNQRSRLDDVLRVWSMVGLAAPAFWVGLVTIILLVHFFDWSSPLRWIPIWETPRESIAQFMLPALTVGLFQAALVTRMTRSAMLDVLSQDYIRAALAKGVSKPRLWFGHALRNAMLPIITIIGVEFATLVGGLIVTETVWNVPGISSYVVLALARRDYPAVQAVVLITAVAVVVVNLITDLSYHYINPRTRVPSI